MCCLVLNYGSWEHDIEQDTFTLDPSPVLQNCQGGGFVLDNHGNLWLTCVENNDIVTLSQPGSLLVREQGT